jgi:hypothetical protein
LTDTIVNTANVARAEGILELQLVEELLEAKKKALLHQFETQLDMIMTGIQSTQFGNNPRIIEQKLRVMY